MGIAILPPDLNESNYPFTVVGGTIRFGLGGVKGVGEGRSRRCSRRAAGWGASRASPTSRPRSSRGSPIARFRVPHQGRRLRFAGCPQKPRSGRRSTASSTMPAGGGRSARWGREPLGGGAWGGGRTAWSRRPTQRPAPWPERERLRYEKETLGFYLTGNPMSEHEEVLRRLATPPRATSARGFEGPATVGGMVSALRRVKIKSGPNAGRLMGASC